MILTLEHFLNLIDKLPKGINFDYVKSGKNKIRLDYVNHVERYIEATKIDTENGNTKSANITTENLKTFVDKVIENRPLHIESVWNGSGSARSAWEGLFAHTSEFYVYFSDGRKHLVWIPSHPHENGKITTLTKDLISTLISPIDLCLKQINYKYHPYVTAIKSKPFLLLAGISGTGKSRIVRELARACWDKDSDEFNAQKPINYEMIQVKPNWHDSSELIGYISRISGQPVFIAGDFLKFIVKAWEYPEIPYFLCLDEMNLAPVEQYFAEYLSVIETRKKNKEGKIVTDALIKPEYKNERYENTKELKPAQWYENLVDTLLAGCSDTNIWALRKQFLSEGISIPQNLIVVGTVNMDETTFSFSRKVLDRAMTIEMNEVDLYSGLTEQHEQIGKLGKEELIGTAVEGVDVYEDNKDVCDKALTYLQAVNNALDTSFKIAYRTRNDFLLYVVNNLPYNKDEQGNDLSEDFVIARALDEITSMKILSRIEGDNTKVTDPFLDNLKTTIEEGLKSIYEDFKTEDSVSLLKLKEMKQKLVSGYTSFWS